MVVFQIDPLLLSAVSAGNERAFEKLFHQYKNWVFTVAFAYTEDQSDAEEIVQEVFLRVWKSKEKLPEIQEFPAWLRTITKNRCLTALKKKALENQRKSSIASYFNETNNIVDCGLQEKEMQELLHNAMMLLSPQQRKIFILSRLQGEDRKVIAQRLGLAPATVSAHLTIALRIVKNYLQGSKEGIASILILYILLQ